MGAQPDTSTSAPEVWHGVPQILAPIFVARLLDTYLARISHNRTCAEDGSSGLVATLVGALASRTTVGDLASLSQRLPHAACWAALVWIMSAVRGLVRAGSGGGSSQQRVRQRKLVLPWTGGRHGKHHTAHAEAHQRADLQQPQVDRAAGGTRKLRMHQTDAAQRAQQHVGKAGKPQPQLVGPHGRR